MLVNPLLFYGIIFFVFSLSILYIIIRLNYKNSRNKWKERTEIFLNKLSYHFFFSGKSDYQKLKYFKNELNKNKNIEVDLLESLINIRLESIKNLALIPILASIGISFTISFCFFKINKILEMKSVNDHFSEEYLKMNSIKIINFFNFHREVIYYKYEIENVYILLILLIIFIGAFSIIYRLYLRNVIILSESIKLYKEKS